MSSQHNPQYYAVIWSQHKGILAGQSRHDAGEPGGVCCMLYAVCCSGEAGELGGVCCMLYAAQHLSCPGGELITGRVVTPGAGASPDSGVRSRNHECGMRCALVLGWPDSRCPARALACPRCPRTCIPPVSLATCDRGGPADMCQGRGCRQGRG